MASFMTELWESIFTPGPTPTILKAANATFAALQLTLLGMLLATYSVHCVVLSILCAGLWWSINWFAAELAELQRRQKEEEEKERSATPGPATAADDSSDTEVDVGTGAATSYEQEGQSVKRRPAPAGTDTLEPKGTPSSASTEDEWEKVSEGEKEK